MMTGPVTAAYDDGEDLPTPRDGFADEHADVLDAVRSISDPATRRAVWAVFVVAALKGRVGR